MNYNNFVIGFLFGVSFVGIFLSLRNSKPFARKITSYSKDGNLIKVDFKQKRKVS